MDAVESGWNTRCEKIATTRQTKIYIYVYTHCTCRRARPDEHTHTHLRSHDTFFRLKSFPFMYFPDADIVPLSRHFSLFPFQFCQLQRQVHFSGSVRVIREAKRKSTLFCVLGNERFGIKTSFSLTKFCQRKTQFVPIFSSSIERKREKYSNV